MSQQNTRNPRGSGERQGSTAWRPALVAGLLIGTLLGTEVASLAWKGLALAATPKETAVAARSGPARPLPAEWRWSPPGVEVEHMFRKLGR